jgi:hypothetical protein
MSDQAISEDRPNRQQLAAQGRTSPGKVTGKLKAALDAMVWDGLKRDDAAAKAGLSIHGLREALRRPHVRHHYLAQLEVLRTSARARNIHVLEEIRDDSGNAMARVQAVKALEQLDNEQQGSAAARTSPGFAIVVVTDGSHTAHMREIDGKSLISQDAVSHQGDDKGD